MTANGRTSTRVTREISVSTRFCAPGVRTTKRPATPLGRHRRTGTDIEESRRGIPIIFALRHIASVIAVAALGFSTGYALSAAEPNSQDAAKPATPADGIYNQAQAPRGHATHTKAWRAC